MTETFRFPADGWAEHVEVVLWCDDVDTLLAAAGPTAAAIDS